MRQLANLVELLRGRAAAELAGYTFLADDGSEESLSWAALDERARAIAATLAEQARPGDRALLLYPPGLDFIAAFFGCLYAGVVAVPAYPPQAAKSFERLLPLIRDARPAVALTTSVLRRRLLAAPPGMPGMQEMPGVPEIPEMRALGSLRCLATDEIVSEVAAAWREPALRGESLAFLQYTSGSTAAPKGVMVTHGNLLHNEEMIRQAFGMSGESVVVGWLPLYHDMGLIGNVLQPLYAGAPCVLMSPAAFLQQPLRWLEAISRFRATVSGGPNFAYDLCVRRIGAEERQRLDLSCWTVAYNGAEPVRADTMDRFDRAFGPCGFRRAAFYPCYGLAEATLFVAGAGRGVPPTVAAFDAAALERGEAALAVDGPGRELVGCGRAWLEQVLLVVEPETARPLAEGWVGEIWVSGPSVASGYWGQPEATERELRARTDGGPEGPFLRTGDLGFLRQGELFVTGRQKDLIILRGRNLYPQDVELTSERSHKALRPGCTAAFAVDVEGEERLVVVQEVDRHFKEDPEELEVAIRQAVAEAHDAQVHAVTLIQAGTLPKTSSGKVQRRACRDRFLTGGLDTLLPTSASVAAAAAVSAASAESVAPGGGEERAVLAFLCEQVAKLAGLPPSAIAGIDVSRPITALGLDSLGAVELSHRLAERFGLLPPLAALLAGPSLTEVAGWIGKAPADIADRLEPAGEEVGDQPLSYGQRALWFLHQVDPEDAAYNVAAALKVQGPLDVDTLEEAVALVTRRHTSLRSSFHPGPEGPVRRVHGRRGAEILTRDATAWSADELREELHREAWRPFALETDPLLRLAIFRLPAGEHVLLITVHHIVSDLWSLAILKRDLDAAYRVLRGDAVQIAAAPRLRYADYVRWQQQRIAGPEGERLWEAWRERLAGELPETTLPPDRPRGAAAAAAAVRGGSLSGWLEADACAALRRLAQAGSTTLSTALLSGFLALLHRYTGQEDLLVGVPTDGRDRPELSGLVGYLVNPVVIRTDLAGDPTPAALLARVRAASLFAFAHREMPFPLLVERLQPVRDASRSPLFQTLFVFQRSPVPSDTTAADLGFFALGAAGATTDLAGMPAASMEFESREVRFDLELVTAEMGSRVGLSLRYDARRFEIATLERLLGHLRNLLAAAAAEPARPLSALPMLSAAERRQLLVDLNRTGEMTADGATLHGLFLEQARRTPAMLAVRAVRAGGESLTYRELAERVARLAGFLLAQGLTPEEPVAVCLKRGVHLVEALLGVMAAGGAYVPIDPKYPRERQAYLLEDSGARFLLTEAELAEGPIDGIRTLLVDAWQDGPAMSAMPAIELPPPLSLSPGLAYLIYTSGSTGRPKGVAIEHGSAVAMVRWALDIFPPSVLARTVASTSVCFDLSIFELFVPLAGGGTVVLVDDALAVPAAAPWEPTLLNTVPSALVELLRQGALPPSVSTVNLAGEPLSRGLVEEAYRTGTVERVYNLYGPSEDTTYSTWALVPPGAGLPVTIGRPLTGSQAYVLDAHGLPVPFGALGELYLGGAGLARGYFRRPALTAERFVPDPFAPAPGRRLYRTGDRVRYRPNGELEFLGRVDQQVKVRGFRIEPGEVEAALTSEVPVREALVTTCELRPGDLQLVAYAVPAEGSGATAESLRAQLRGKLPEFMIPTLWVLLPALPRTPNGKVDRRALPAPSVPAGAGAAPRNELEALLAGLFADLLQVDRVGRDDSFFALGGHSLLATQLVSRMREALGAELSLQTVFASPTVAALAGLAAISETSAGTALPPIERVARDGALPQSFAQSRLWFIHRLAPGSPSYNMPCAVLLVGTLQPMALTAALAEIVRRHEVLRTTFPLIDGQPAQSIAPSRSSWTLLLPRLDLSGLPGEIRAAEEERLTRHEARRPFDLGRGPVLRCFLVRGSAEEHVLLVTLHHIAADGWSIGILARELSTLYRAFAARQPSPLPELPIQYADFAVWQRRFLSGEVSATQLSYWRRQLAGLPDGLDLPLDRPRPALPTLSGGLSARAFPDALRLAIHHRCREQGATFFMLVLAVFATFLARLTRQTDLVMGSPIANRNRLEIEGLIGFFVNTLVLRIDASGAPPFVELLGRAREAALGAGAHQDMPFERLVEELAPERSLDRTPLFQVACVVQNVPFPTLALPGLSSQVRPVHTGTSNFDLTLTFAETDGVLQASLEYKTALFDERTIDRFLGHLVTLTAAAVADPGTPVSRLPILTTTERHQLAAEPLARVRPFPSGVPLHRLFERQVAQTPAAVAVTGEGGGLTYAELDRRADRLAARLREQGVGPEVRVALWLDRTVELVVAVLGVLKAGGAYVPLDPSYPEDRLRFLLADAGAPVLVSVGELRARLELSGAGVATVLLDRLGETGPAPLASPTPDLPESTAYVIYTSGSTGRPKGVPVHHANAARLFTATAEWFGFGDRDVWTLFHSYAFDFSVWELWGALLHGGRLVVVPYWVSRSPEAFYDLLAREQVTVLNQTPSAFHPLATAEEGRAASGSPSELALSWVIFGGEALEPRRLAGWYARHGDRRPTLVNMYGITETTVHVTFRPLAQGDLERGSVIGVPIPDLYLHLLDGEREPVALGLPGEIHVGGAGLARGYLNRPDLTAERFVPDPFAGLAGVPGARLYASGDLARRRPDGELEYLGRADQQVKIRGFRIEPGEIEAALAEHPAVREVVVLARDGQEGRRLVAWLGVGSGPATPPGVDELRSFLQSRLPEHMIPAVFVLLATLPLSVHGKVDHRALPEPAAVRPELGAVYVAPRGPEEEVLAEVWAEVLELDRVGVHDNFFALGGDSIRSIRVLALAEARGLSFSLPQLFRYQTIAELAPYRLTPAAPKAALAPFALVTAAERAALPEDVEDAYPLSALQLGMLFHSDFGGIGGDGSSTLYHNVSTVRLSRALDTATLRIAAAKLALRHPILRTSFDPVGCGRPLQRVHRAVTVPVTAEDLSGLEPVAQEAAVARRFAEEKANRFDWGRPPLLRFHFQHLGGSATQFFWTEHHVILDGWSLAVLLAELFELYEAELAGTPASPAPVSTFREFIAREREVLESEAAREFWANRLRDAAPARLLPWHPDEENQDRAPVLAPLPDSVLAGLRDLAALAAVPLKNVFLAAHVWVVGRITGTRDVVTGLVTNGRPEAADADRILGLFLNSVPLRTALAGGSWSDLARQMFAAEREILPFRSYPLPEIQRELGATQLFDVSFNYVNFHVLHAAEKTYGLALDRMQIFSETSIPLALDVVQLAAQDAVLLSVQRDPAAVNQDQLRAIVDLYQRVLAGMATVPGARYDLADLLSPAERQQLVAEWNDTALVAAHLESERTHELFEGWAARTPEAPALLSAGGELTYRELNRRANRIARRLRAAGAGPEVAVGLYVERSPEMIAGVLGILKAGAAYVPLDPAYPQERLALMMEDVRMPLVLTQERLAGGLAGLSGEVIALDGLDRLGETGPGDDANPESGVAADNLAYAIFTSGSTGRPKPVGVSHRALTHHMAGTRQVLRMAEHRGDRVLQFSTLNFDGSVDQIFIALVNGGCLGLREEELWSAEELEARIAEMGLTIIDLPTGYWSEWVRARSALAERAEDESLRVVYVGGEAMLAEELSVWWRSPRNRTVRLLNAYGPTETVVAASYLEATCRESAGPLFERVAIGRPLGDRALHVVDPEGRLAPVGVPGELLIAGEPILARGYLGRPDLTAERFLPDPFAGVPGARLYRTGDLGRYLPDGRREFLGRVDDQVKVRGFRIELGEVEAALAEHPAVHRAAAVVHGAGRNHRLVAYFTPIADLLTPPTAAELRIFLQGKLPEPMVPSDIVLLDRLPLTPNGKVDRRALPVPEMVRSALGAEYVAPRTPEEEAVAAVWAEVLELDRVGVDDSFFDLGGDSIRSIRFLSLAAVRGLRFSLADLFEHPTIADLVPHRLTAPADPAGAVPSSPLSLLTSEERAALPEDVEDAYPVSTLQLGMLFHSGYHERGERSSAYHNVFSLRLSRGIDAAAFRAAAGQLALRHPVLRTAFDLGGFSRPLQLVRRAVEIPVTAEDLAGLPPAEREAAVARRLEDEKARLFAPDQAPLLRFHVQHLGDSETQLFWTGHHVILDGWSAAVLLAELFQLYQVALAVGTESPPPPPPVTTFRDFIALERAALESAQAREFWEARLRDVDPPRLLLWHPEEENRDRTPINVALPGPVLAGLRELAANASVPLKNVFLAAHVWVVGRMTGTRDVVTGLVTNGRPEAADADRVLGLFLNTVPLATALAGGTWHELARQMFAAEREILPFRRFPLSEIQRQLGVARLFETSFNFVNFYVAAEAQQASGLQLDKFRFVGETSIPLAIDFSQDTVADIVRLNAQRDPAVVNQDQLRATVDLYQRVLAGMATAPGARYDLADLLSPAERQQLVAEWNDTALVAAHLESERTHELFEGWAARTPEAPALLSASGRLTYRELNRRANRIARRLRAAGAGPEVAVGLYVERSPEMIAGVLGILKAGAAYVPLDPAYPQERLALMMEDVRMPLVLTQERLAGSLAGLSGEVIALDGLDRLGETGPGDDANPKSGVAADNLAYAIFTSGSTGRPKPVGVSHRALTHHMAGTRQVLRMAEHPGDRVLQFSTLNFDGSVDQIFIALVNGGCLGLREEELWSAEELEARIAEMGLTIIDLPTGYWSEWVRARSALAERAESESLRVVYVGGEAMLAEELSVWWRSPRNRTVRLLNAYGPTETVVAASYLEATCRESAGPLFERVAIGRPLGDRALHVVDPEGRLAPVGVPGELLIAGEPILARGYLGRPDLTAERFLPDPFAGVPGARLYRTGDLGRYLPDGRREFLGRVDDQVKVRGFRIELGEVEAALAEHPAVHRAAAVVYDKGGPSQRRLVAYATLVNHGTTAATAAELRAFLHAKLPEPMVPSEIILLDRLPLTPNGKVDRRALPAPELSARRDGEPIPAPRTAAELQLAGIWEELLEVSPIGVTDNFLELGGHSLLAVRLMARIEHVFGVQLPISALFEAPTVERLAAVLEDREAPLRRSPLVRLHPGGAGRPLYLVHPVGGDVFAYVELAKKLGAERPVYGLQAMVENGVGTAPPTMEELAAQYLKEVREIQAEGPYLLAGWSLGAVIAYEMAQQIERSGDRVALLAMIDPSAPADGQAEGTDDTSLLAGFAFDLVRLSGRPVPLGPEVLAGLDVDAGLDCLVELGRAAGVLPPDVDQPRLRERFDLFSRNVKALQGYAPRPYGGRVALFRASASLAPGTMDPAFGWSVLANAEAHLLDADHYSLLQRPALDSLVERLDSALTQVEADAC